MDKYIIRLENKEDYFNVEKLTREAFWNVYRPKAVEHYVLHNFRNKPNFVRELDLVLELNGEIIGHIMFAKTKLLGPKADKLSAMTFGPFSIKPKYQHKGYGEMLLNNAINKAKMMGVDVLLIEGNYDYYKKYGFKLGKDLNIIYKDDPNADYFLVLELKNNSLAGISAEYEDPKEYFVDDKDVEMFDKIFN